jgi:hypothetical protein
MEKVIRRSAYRRAGQRGPRHSLSVARGHFRGQTQATVGREARRAVHRGCRSRCPGLCPGSEPGLAPDRVGRSPARAALSGAARAQIPAEQTASESRPCSPASRAGIALRCTSRASRAWSPSRHLLALEWQPDSAGQRYFLARMERALRPLRSPMRAPLPPRPASSAPPARRRGTGTPGRRPASRLRPRSPARPARPTA